MLYYQKGASQALEIFVKMVLTIKYHHREDQHESFTHQNTL